MQVSRDRRILVCDQQAGGLLKSTFLSSVLVKDTTALTLFDITEHEISLPGQLASLGLRLSPRYMDCFYFCLSSNLDRDRRNTLEHFFDFLAPMYFQHVDVTRNRANAANLIQLIRARTDRLGPVLDFGCGIGLAKTVADARRVQLAGYEPNSRMRAQALAAGLRVWGRLDVETECAEPLHAAMASYVLHLPGTLDDVQLVWRALLRPPAIFVANFHKSVGFEEAARVFQALGATVEAVNSPASWRRHGDYVVFHRRFL